MLLHEEADQIVLESPPETVSSSCNVEEDLTDFAFVGPCKKVVKVKNIILIQRPYSRKPFRSHSKEIIIFPRCYIYEVKDIYCSRKEKLAKGRYSSRDPAMMLSVCLFIKSQDHVFWLMFGTHWDFRYHYIRFRKICQCIHDRIHWYITWRRVDEMLPSVHHQ